MSFVAEAQGSSVRVKRSGSCELSIASPIHKCFKGRLELGDRSLATTYRRFAANSVFAGRICSMRLVASFLTWP